ncbi:SHOCT domain-containing protein [Gordonia rhizosphera]|uniref:SHOCT domain-containing protein n=1 Tax=Gordonia rhizosphera NBRC 16068 TaxID=1108045 RepID=K6WHC7_9ACTN|nr:SHOCT domain-containing protein [Gordonia rhizosphera]GAB91562.1 hypothetical protein GORHZ_137_00010 [Gordonia rhizosphera NBRC 16068]
MTMFGEVGAGPRVPGALTSFLKTFAFVMLCGIVGPIFLVGYVLIDAPDTEWMLWTGLAVTVLDVIVAAAISWVAYRSRVTSARLHATGRMAVADITAIEPTNVEINDQPLMKLGLHIRGGGVVPFDDEKRMVVPAFQQPMLHRRMLAVVVDPETNEYEIDWQATALLTGSVPARFTSSEDGRTYDLTGQAEPLLEILEILRQHGITTTGPIDLRSNPAARQSVMNVVRSYAGGGVGTPDDPVADRRIDAPVVAPAASPNPRRSLGERLADLEDLRISGAITEQEYLETRNRILDTI